MLCFFFLPPYPFWFRQPPPSSLRPAPSPPVCPSSPSSASSPSRLSSLDLASPRTSRHHNVQIAIHPANPIPFHLDLLLHDFSIICLGKVGISDLPPSSLDHSFVQTCHADCTISSSHHYSDGGSASFVLSPCSLSPWARSWLQLGRFRCKDAMFSGFHPAGCIFSARRRGQCSRLSTAWAFPELGSKEPPFLCPTLRSNFDGYPNGDDTAYQPCNKHRSTD